jgi:hypothetical protein
MGESDRTASNNQHLQALRPVLSVISLCAYRANSAPVAYRQKNLPA